MEIPKLYDSYLLLFTFFFIFIYCLGYFIILKHWSKKYRAEASTCAMSLAHGTPAVFLALFSILKSHQSISLNQLNFASPNTALENMVLEFSTAYFLMDLFNYIVLIPLDVLFIAHHLATLYVLLTCRYVLGHGAVAILGILVLAEITTLCQNTWSLARYRKVDSEKAAKLYEFLSPIFFAYYTMVRGILGPLFAYKIGVFFASGMHGDLIPLWAWISWMVVTVSTIGVSLLWIMNQWLALYRNRIKKELKKIS